MPSATFCKPIERVEGKVAGKTFAEFEADWEFRFIVQRAIEIISEATRRLPDELKARRPEIRWRKRCRHRQCAST